MKTRLLALLAFCALPFAASAQVQPPDDPVGKAVAAYFDRTFANLKAVADKQPTKDTFRDAMKPLEDATDGFFGGSFIDTDFVIREVYYPRDFLARGFDLKKVKQLDYFWDLMRKNPTPQLSEPGHGSIIQPRLIAMRYPVLKDGKLAAVVSFFVRTEKFLADVRLGDAKAYRIICRGVHAEEDGTLGADAKRVTVALPANEWVIEYSK